MLTTVDRLQKAMGIQGDSLEEEMLQIQIAASSQAIENYCKRSFKLQSYTERHSGNSRSSYINLRNYPVKSIEQVVIPGKTVGEYEVLDEGRVFCPSGWPAGEQNINVTYTAGYVLPGDETEDNPRTLPEVLELACLFHAQLMLRTPGVTAERVGDISVNYSAESEGMPPTVVALISPYVGRWV
ncbi:phage gp6-like head-tail connector protein [Paenibacillus sp. FSL K6-0276]|uniref:phage gp6-like head-tail connector protein n=1 Tax=Paenibacillus sp. FSL K6-0276 TaxID=2921450 RepID=UPI0030EB8123